MKATAYCTGTKTAMGYRVREGMCASKREWFGRCAAVYLKDSEGNLGIFLGYYFICDTGGEPIRNGRVIDIYMKSRSDAILFGSKRVAVFIYEGAG